MLGSAHLCGVVSSQMVLVPRENFSVNKRAYKNIQLKIELSGFMIVCFFKFYIWLSRLSSKKSKMVQYEF